MRTSFRKSFARDLKKTKDRVVLDRVQDVIEKVQAAGNLQEISDLRKLSGTENCYRIRIGDYRIGLLVEEDTIVFVRCLNRRDLYRYFP